MKKVLSLVLTVGIALTYASHPAYAANKHNFEQGASQILDKFENLDPDSFFSDVDLDDGKLFVSGLLSSDEISDDIDVFSFLDENKALFDLDSLTSNLEIEKEETDELGFKHIKLQQCIDNIPIEDKSVTVHCNQDGQVVNVTADVEKDIDSFTTLGEKKITTGQAVKIAEKQFTYKELAYEPPVELVAHVKDGKAYKAYKVNVKFYEPE
ncbi:MAG: peptidase M4 family protein, partial [Clostridium sp.]